MLGRRLLGVSVGERFIIAAEVRHSREGSIPTHVVEIPLADGFADPQACGLTLRARLREAGISSRSAVFGLPLSWMLARLKDAPKTDPVSAAAVLRLEAEQEFAVPTEELVLDTVVAAPVEDATPRLFVLATPTAKIAAIREIARASRLRPVAAVPCALAAAQASDAEGAVASLIVGREAVEFVVSWRGAPLLLRHLGQAPDAVSQTTWAASTGTELRRALMMLSPAPKGFVEPDEIIVWDDVGLSNDARTALGAAAPLPIRMQECALPTAEGSVVRCAVAAALANAPRAARHAMADFLHSKLAVRKPSRRRRTLVTGGAAAAAVAAVVVAAGIDITSRRHEVASLREQVRTASPRVSNIRRIAGYVATARQWREDRPRFLDCLRQVTLAFPAEGSVWATSLAIRQDMRGLLSGKALSDKAVLEVLDTMKKQEGLSSVKLVYLRGGGASSREVAFAISFSFTEATAQAFAASETEWRRQ